MSRRIFSLKDMTPDELESFVVKDLGLKRYRCDQLLFWLYKKPVSSFHEMTNLPKSLREELEDSFVLYSLELEEVLTSRDGTQRFLFSTHDSLYVESVMIPDNDRVTVCVSTQVGCRMGCRFCLTGKSGFKRNLTVSEIVDQIIMVRNFSGKVTNVVFMGMGEPFDNYDNVVKAISIIRDSRAIGISYRKITVSTVGLIPFVSDFLKRKIKAGLSISLNAAYPEKRLAIMPVERSNPMYKLIEVIRKLYPKRFRKRVTFEYVLLSGINDTDEDAFELARLLEGINCKVNLIPFNEWENGDFTRPTDDRVERFRRILDEAGYPTFVRKSRGSDILAACGQLSWRKYVQGHSYAQQDHNCQP